MLSFDCSCNLLLFRSSEMLFVRLKWPQVRAGSAGNELGEGSRYKKARVGRGPSWPAPPALLAMRVGDLVRVQKKVSHLEIPSSRKAPRSCPTLTSLGFLSPGPCRGSRAPPAQPDIHSSTFPSSKEMKFAETLVLFLVRRREENVRFLIMAKEFKWLPEYFRIRPVLIRPLGQRFRFQFGS